MREVPALGHVVMPRRSLGRSRVILGLALAAILVGGTEAPGADDGGSTPHVLVAAAPQARDGAGLRQPGGLPLWSPPPAVGSSVTPTSPAPTSSAGASTTPARPTAPAKARGSSPAASAHAAIPPTPRASGPSGALATAWPGATSTGVPAGVRLSPSGPITVTKPGTVIDGLDVSGSISVEAAGVVIRNCFVHGNGTGDGIAVSEGDVTVEDTEIAGFENGIGYDDWTARRVNIHSVSGDGVKLGSNVLLEASWIHDFTPATDAHADGGQMQDGVTNLVVRGNRIDVGIGANYNSAIFLSPTFGPSTDGPVSISGNRLSGGGYTLDIVDGANGEYHVGHITVTGNVFGSSQYGPARVLEPVTWSGNITTTGETVTY